MLTSEQIYVGALIRFNEHNNTLYYNKLAIITAIHEEPSFGSLASRITMSIKFHGINNTFDWENPIYYDAVDP